MSLQEAARPAAAPVALTEPAPLIATRRLRILDELRVPYELDHGVAGSRWASLGPADGRGSLLWFTPPAGEEGQTASGWSLGSIRLWGRVAPEAETRALTGSRPGEWRREAPILDRRGTPRAWVWRDHQGSTVLPFDPDELVSNLRSERYLRLPPSRLDAPKAACRRGYYALRPLLPRGVQVGLRRGFSRMQARTTFPRWPIEPSLHDLVDLVLGLAADAAGRPIPHLGAWPRGRSWALVLTHDVETEAGREAIERLRTVEQAAGCRSAWNLVPERYRSPDELIDHLKLTGCEVGVHGLRHDGRDLHGLDTPRSRLPAMRRWARRWDAVGFRSPATHRAWEAMPRLGFAYDSSYPDTDPFEPMGGGCCSWLPFFNRQMVELPITLVQDHSLFVILRRDESLWHEKVQFLRARGGMALAVVHPDYMLEDGRLEAYRRLLETYGQDPSAWQALPREVADWWRRRAATSLRFGDGGWRPAGPAAGEAEVRFAQPPGGARPLLRSPSLSARARPRVWIDIENPPQVQYLLPFRDRFAAAGLHTIVTARDYGRTVEMLEAAGIRAHVSGHRVGGGRIRKGSAAVLRAAEQVRLLRRAGVPDAVLAASRSAAIAAWQMRIPAYLVGDYEHIHLATYRLTRSHIFYPEVVGPEPYRRSGLREDQLIPFRGLKEDVTFAGVDIDAVAPFDLNGLSAGAVRVLFRPPAETSHYYDTRSTELARAALDWLSRTDAALVFCPREEAQVTLLEGLEWRHPPLILRRPVPFAALLGSVDLVVCAGGTMLREAAYLGIPAYSIFGSRTGAVDRWLQEIGRVTLLGSETELSAIELRKRGPLRRLDSNPHLLDELAETVIAAAVRRAESRTATRGVTATHADTATHAESEVDRWSSA